MRELATIQIIESLEKHPNADTLEIAHIKGWEVITKIGDFNEGDWCIFFEIDSIVPDYSPVFAFMSKRKYRVRTQKLRGIVSQGLAMPVSILDTMREDKHLTGNSFTWQEGEDLTEMLGVKKHDPEGEKERSQARKQGKSKNPLIQWMKQYAWFRKLHFHVIGSNTKNFPWFISKTDENRIQNMPFIFTQHDGKKCYIMEKLDGQSVSFAIYTGKKFSFLNKIFGTSFYVCSRNLCLYTKSDTNWWNIAIQEEVEKKLRSEKKNIAIQGEIIGEGIQKNKYKLKGLHFRLFNVIDIDKNYKYNINEKTEFCDKHGFKLVPYLGTITLNKEMKVSDMIEKSKGKSLINSKILKEGIVIRSIEDDRISFKAINPDFLIKYEC